MGCNHCKWGLKTVSEATILEVLETMVCDLELNPNSQGLDRVMVSREEQVEK